MSEWSFDSPEGIQEREVGLEAVLKKIRYDITAAQGKLTEALRMVSEMDLVEQRISGTFMNGPVTARACPSCGCGSPAHTADCEQADAA